MPKSKSKIIRSHGARVTLSAIAKRLDVSVTTVSKALRGMSGVSPEMAQTIKDLAKDLKYQPNLFARGLKTAQSRVIGLLISSDITIPWYANLVSRLEEKFSAEGFNLMLGLGKSSCEKERQCLETFQGGHVAGVIAGPIFNRRDMRAFWDFIDSGIPIVIFSCLEEIPVNYVAIDVAKGAALAIDHFVSKGHKRIGYLCCPPSSMEEVGLTRKQGYEKGLFKYDLPLVGKDILIGYATKQNGFDLMTKYIMDNSDNLATAFFCHNDASALGALNAIKRAGLKCPENISLIGFDDIEDASFSSPALTTLGNVMDELVIGLKEILLNNLANEKMPLVRKKISPILIERESVCSI